MMTWLENNDNPVKNDAETYKQIVEMRRNNG